MIGKIWSLIETICRVVLSALWRLTGRELSEEMLAAFLQFVRFGIVGVSNTVIAYITYAGSLLAIRAVFGSVKMDYLAAQVVSFILSVLWSFYWNNKMVFTLEEGQHRSLGKALVKTYISYSFTGLFLNSLLLYVWVQVLGISEFIAPIINLIVSVPVNFIINKYWAFRTEKG